jgi:hypothetical protein
MPVDVQACWADLAADSPQTGYAAIERLAASGTAAVTLLRKHLEPPAIEPGWLAARLAALDSDSFADREQATYDLQRVVNRIETELRRELERTQSFEVRSRIQAALEVTRVEDIVRTLRAVTVLERIGSREAGELLERLAKVPGNTRLNQEAKVALERNAARSAR